MRTPTRNLNIARLLTCGVLVFGTCAYAGLAIVNGDFENNAPPAGSSVADVEDWYDRTGAQGAYFLSTWYGSAASPNGTSLVGLSWEGGEGHWAYQNIGVNDEGLIALGIQFDLAAWLGADIGIEVAVYQGPWEGAADDVDIVGNATLIDAALVTRSLPSGVMETVTVTLGLATANSTEPLWLRFVNVSVEGSDPWAFIDNVLVLSGSVGSPVITAARMTGSGLQLEGVNGPANGAYRMLRSAAATQPVAGWTDMGIHTFDPGGGFSYTDADLAGDRGFYGLQVVSGVPVFPPVVTMHPLDVGIIVGQTAVFNVTATGTPPLTYRWFHNTNTLIASGPVDSLVIPNAQLADSGTFSVTVSNLLGVDDSDFAMLTVTNLRPFIITPPQGTLVWTGMTAMFTVEVGGSVPFHYQWFYNTNTVLANESNATLTLNNVQLSDAGQYSVLITNDYGNTISDAADLLVEANAGPVGWASVNGGTTGGAGGDIVTVTTKEELNSALSSSETLIINVSGMISFPSETITGSGANKTIQGVDTDSGWYGSVKISGATATNIILRNLTLKTENRDPLLIQSEAKNVWVDHCSFVHGVDELISMKDGADYITISWCRFSFESEGDHNLAALIGSTNDHPVDEGHLNITWHHNWFADRVHGRMPRVRYGKNHVFNNYYAVPNHDGYCITANWDSQILVENNYFYKVESPYNTADAGAGHPGRLRAVGNVLDQCFGSTSSGRDTVFTPPYAYTLENPATARAKIIAGAGNTF